VSAIVHGYADDVLSGKIIAGPHVRHACRRHLRDIERAQKGDSRFWWDEAAAQQAFDFFEEVLVLSGGRWERQPFRLLPWQSFCTGSIHGWKRHDNGKRRIRKAYIETAKGPLDLDTPILTIDGWSTMGQLRVGDQVFAPDGTPTEVIGTSPVFRDRDCYELSFDCGETIVADSAHEWITEQCRYSDRSGDTLKGIPLAERGHWRIARRTTQQIVDTLRYTNGPYQSANHSIPVAPPLQRAANPLPLDPYVLGFWLGDGDSDGGRVTIGARDFSEQCALLESHGARWGAVQEQRTGVFRIGIRGLHRRLKDLGLLRNKHIPAMYLMASVADRTALLQGLLDADGTIGSGQSAEYCSMSRRLADDVLELMRGLGLKVRLRASAATLRGQRVGTRYRIHFAPGNLPVFALPRKAALLGVSHVRKRLASDHRIVEARPVESRPVRCITVAHPSHQFLAGRALIATCNSGKTPWAGGEGIQFTCADGEFKAEGYVLARTADQALVPFRFIANMIRESDELVDRFNISGGEDFPYNASYRRTLSFLRRVTSVKGGKGQSGPSPHFILLEEFHEHDEIEKLELLDSGTKWREQPLTLIITNAGSDPVSPCGQEHAYACKVAAGPEHDDPVEDDSYFSYVCALDEHDDPFTDEDCWIKANPSLPEIPGYDYIREQVNKARGMPSRRAIVERLNFCIWTEAVNPWIEREVWIAAERQERELPKHIDEAPCYAALDIGLKRDLCAGALVWDVSTKEQKAKKEDHYAARLCVWTPKDTLKQRSEDDGAPYVEWAEQGHLVAVPGKILRLSWVARWIRDQMNAYNLQGLAYDPWRIDLLENALDDLDVPYTRDIRGRGLLLATHHQGFVAGVKKSKKVENEVALWMPRSIDCLEDSLVRERIVVLQNPCVRMAVLGAAVITDGSDNRKLTKLKSEKRIDPMVALTMARGLASAPLPRRRRKRKASDYLLNMLLEDDEKAKGSDERDET